MAKTREKSIPKENFPTGSEIRANKGWMKKGIILLWLKTVWFKRPRYLFKPRALVIMDSMTVRLKECAELGAKLSIILSKLTKKFI